MQKSSPPSAASSRVVPFPRTETWQLRARTLRFGIRPAIMGILNVTPDSFSDGGRYFEAEVAVRRGLQLVEQGADILDIGGESTRPYSESVPVAEELRRVAAVVRELAGRTEVPISIDTSKAEVARVALEQGAEIVNDVTGLEGDPEMLEVVRQFSAGVCVMHMRGTPRDMQDDPRYEDVVQDIGRYLAERRDTLLAGGIERARICLDPGIGFGKTHQHNLTLMAHCGSYHQLGCPLLVGHSRKGFIGKVLQLAGVSAGGGQGSAGGGQGSAGGGQGAAEGERTFGTVGAALSLALQGIQVIRVHDVAAVRQALLLFEACGGFDGREWILPA